MGILSTVNNFKVGTRLAAGFGSVILLALGLTVLGIQGQDQIRDRLEKTGGVNDMVARLKDARVAEQAYVGDPDPDHAQALDAAVKALAREAEQIKALFDDAYNREAMDRILGAAEDYRAAFAHYVQLTESGRGAEDVMGDSADRVLAQIEAVVTEQQRQARELVSAGAVMAEIDEKLDKVDDAEQLQKWMLLARRAEKNHMLRDEARYTAEVEQLVDDMVALVRDLRTRYDVASHRQAADAVIEGLEGYRRAFRDYVQSRADATRARDDMVAGAEAALAVTAATRDDQRTKMAEEMAALRTGLILVAAFALVLGGLAAWAITLGITRPLRRAVATIGRIADGDLTVETEVTGRDETAQLMAAVDRMTRALRGTIARVKQSTEQLASAASELSSVTEEASEGTNQQMAETEQVATAMNEMAATVGEVARSAGDTASATDEGRKAVSGGRAVVLEAVSGIRALSEDLDGSAQSIARLRDQSVEIGAVLDVIRGVAEQTNLLALNAAIEAARAGDHGKGFAVVAAEVRTLAQRTQASTSEIEAIITALQTGADAAAEAMAASNARSDQTVAQADEAGRALGEIDRLVGRISEMTTQIAQAAEEQSSTAELINESITNITQIAERNAAGGTQTAAASSELAQLGEQLRGEVARFAV